MQKQTALSLGCVATEVVYVLTDVFHVSAYLQVQEVDNIPASDISLDTMSDSLTGRQSRPR